MVTRFGPVAGPEVPPNSAPKTSSAGAAPPMGVHCPVPRHAGRLLLDGRGRQEDPAGRRVADLARLSVRPRRPDRSAAHRHERAAGRAVTVTPGCNCRRVLRAVGRREVKSLVGGVASRRQRACDERPEPGFRVDESILAQRPVHLLPGCRGDPELGLELEHRRHAGARRVGALRDPLPDYFGDLAPPWLVRNKFDHLAKLGRA